jgi:transcriptional regulator with XRE-family HTH domain
MKPNKKRVGERIQEIRKSLGYSMDEFGRMIGNTPRSSVNNWEKGISIPKRDSLEQIAFLGKMKPEQILYGQAVEYLYDLFDQNLNVRFDDVILYEIFEFVPPEKRSYDHHLWLQVAKYFLENGTYGKVAGSLIYTSVLGIDNLYAGRYKNEFIEQKEDYNILEIKYYIYVEKDKNRLHVIPFSLQEKNKKLFFEFPNFIKEKNNHQYFTENFKQVGLTLEGSSIIYYGIDKDKHHARIQLFNYNEEKDCYDVGSSCEDDYYSNFKQELQKEHLQLEQ